MFCDFTSFTIYFSLTICIVTTNSNITGVIYNSSEATQAVRHMVTMVTTVIPDDTEDSVVLDHYVQHFDQRNEIFSYT